jgi:hypothetical protein
VAIRNTLSNNNVSIIPNPGSDFPTLNYVSTDDKTASLKISDSKGEIVKELQIESKKGTNILTLDLSEIKPGIYLFNLMNESNLIFTSKFVKL